ncbi:MAG TPA: cyclopropane-fatty-acyl-phospholipid synthase family protein, partial [Terriglobales bacterium]|nr:cyclopropane-fatty-acyl-phospholipid synthase family protein [Terriglobales bacterium]
MHLLAKPPQPDASSRSGIEFFDALFRDYPVRDFRVRLWDGSTWGAENQARLTLVLKHPGALRAMFSSPSELTLGEAYIRDDFDLEGDIEAAFELGDYLLGQLHGMWKCLEVQERLHQLPPPSALPRGLHLVDLTGKLHSKARDRQAVRFHYDLPVDFYALWLDRRLVYSCAYFISPDDDLDEAQEHKLDYICRKLRLRPGERLLDIGCGWGGLVLHAAAYYGVRALGVTLSERQAKVACQRVCEAGLNERCRVELRDYRDLDPDEQFDKIVSVGMFEHVGETHLPGYFRQVWDLLCPGGVFLNAGISHSATYRRRGPSFIDRYVFPDGDLVPISTSLRAAELRG